MLQVAVEHAPLVALAKRRKTTQARAQHRNPLFSQFCIGSGRWDIWRQGVKKTSDGKAMGPPHSFAFAGGCF